MSASGPNIQLELRLAEMARMNEEIRRRHNEVEADKRRAQRDGLMVSRDQSITMATVMPTDFDTSREDGFKDGLDSRPLPADPYGKDRVPREKRGKPQDKMNTKQANKSRRQQTIDEARQRGMNDQDYWRQEQARADAARIKRAQGRDGTWRREWDREKNHSDERSNEMNSGGFRSKRDKQFRRSGDKDLSRQGGGSRGGYSGSQQQGGQRGQGGERRRNKRQDYHDQRVRRQSNENDYQTRRSEGSMKDKPTRYTDRKKKQSDRKDRRNQGRDSEPMIRPKSPDKGSSDDDAHLMNELNEYSSDEGGAGRMRRRSSGSESNQSRESDHELMGPKVPDNLMDHDIELPPSIESNQSEQSQSDEEDDIDIRDQLLILLFLG